MVYRIRLGICVVLLTGWGTVAWSQTQVPTDTQEVASLVARSLLNRGKELFHEQFLEQAKELFIESIETAPNAPTAVEAKQMIRLVNRRLGLVEIDHGIPTTFGTHTVRELRPEDDLVVTPEASTPTPDPAFPVVPTSPVPDAPPTEVVSSQWNTRRIAQNILYATGGGVWGGTIGGAAGDELGAAFGTILGVGLGYSVGSLIGRKRVMSESMLWGSFGGMFALGAMGGFVADIVNGVDHDSVQDTFWGISVGSSLGALGGWLAVRRISPSLESVQLVNGGALLGTLFGGAVTLLIDSPNFEAYGLDMSLGMIAGTVGGVLIARSSRWSSRRIAWVVGGGVGGGTLLGATGGMASGRRLAGGLGAAGVVLGSGIAWIFTRNMDESPATSVAWVPTAWGTPSGLQIGMQGVF